MVSSKFVPRSAIRHRGTLLVCIFSAALPQIRKAPTFSNCPRLPTLVRDCRNVHTDACENMWHPPSRLVVPRLAALDRFFLCSAATTSTAIHLHVYTAAQSRATRTQATRHGILFLSTLSHWHRCQCYLRTGVLGERHTTPIRARRGPTEVVSRNTLRAQRSRTPQEFEKLKKRKHHSACSAFPDRSDILGHHPLATRNKILGRASLLRCNTPCTPGTRTNLTLLSS